MLYVGIFIKHTLCSLYWNQKTSHEQNEFSYGLTFWFISIGNSGKYKSENTSRVEINQFCDG